jgi:hypothetical protein
MSGVLPSASAHVSTAAPRAKSDVTYDKITQPNKVIEHRKKHASKRKEKLTLQFKETKSKLPSETSFRE